MLLARAWGRSNKWRELRKPSVTQGYSVSLVGLLLSATMYIMLTNVRVLIATFGLIL